MSPKLMACLQFSDNKKAALPDDASASICLIHVLQRIASLLHPN